MRTEDLSTLKINKLTQAQYDKALQEGRINENELYLTPDNIGVNGLPENAEFKNLTINDGYNGKIYLEGGNSEGVISAGVLSLGYKAEEGNYTLTYMPEDGIEMHQDNYTIYLIHGQIGLENEYARAYIGLNNELSDNIEVYLPNKSGTLATLDDIASSGGSSPTDPEFESVKIGDIYISDNEIYMGDPLYIGKNENGGYVVTEEVGGTDQAKMTPTNIGVVNDRYDISLSTIDGGLYMYDNVEDIETFYNSGYIINNGEIINLPAKSGTLATLEDLGDINSILDILNGEVV